VYANDSSAAYHVELGLQKYNEVYLHNHFENGKVAGGRIEYVRLFSIIAIFILLIACINFMNLSTARSVNRAKEVGIRKVLGTERKTLITQFLVESTITAWISLFIAVIIAYLVLPVFNDVAAKSMSINNLLGIKILSF